MDALMAQAMNRFGLGRRGNEPLPGDPEAWLRAQITGPDPAQFDRKLASSADALIVLREQHRLALPQGSSLVRPLYEAEVAAQTEQMLTTDAPFRERLVWFWTNHFTVSIRQGDTHAVTGPFIREAIRPNVTGSFLTMLLAVMRHPAMLMYLDNVNSVGPDSPDGQRSHRGLNENLARECLELHTLSPEAGYTQADVTEFAKVLTGWSVDWNRAEPGFVFRDTAHEPGGKTVLGQRIPPGETGGLLALAFLADHPATHRHLAGKLAQHFIADTPPPASVRAIESALRDTGGDLGAAALAIVAQKPAWQPLAKFRSPQDYAVAALRALDLPAEKRPKLPGVLNRLGQPLWAAPLPNGWPDRSADWGGSEAALRRVDWSYDLAGHAADHDPLELAEAAIGPPAPATLEAIRHAGSRRDAVTLLFTSPEFQRR